VTGFSLSDWDRVGDLVEQALELEPSARDAFLRRACAADPDRLDLARRTLQAATGASAFLSRPAAEVAADLIEPADASEAVDAERLPATIGPYRVLRLLGRGGMGEVYLADRADDEFQRQVAIKVVRPGLGRDWIARFRHERQVLASLDHPNIARLYDGGVTGDGRPYLVMEFVDGRPLDHYADAERLTVDQRLALFAQVCDAVERAHRRLIVHRDLKPGNVLVTSGGLVKLLDFGVAKLLDPATAPDDPPLTATGMRIMTPEYASPEQFLGEPVTTATDVYALGVMLFELLAGCPPHDTGAHRRDTLERRVLDTDPAAPSAACRLNTSGAGGSARADSRRTTIDGLARRLRGDLDNIVLTALRREPERRYPSVAALREDIERHRAGLPVAARPATLRYRTVKFLRRNRVAVTAAVLLTGAVVAGATSTLVQARAAAREGRRAEQIRDFLVSVFEVSSPDRAGGETVTARQLLDRGSARVNAELASEPVLRSDMLVVLGRLYRQLGLYDPAGRHLQEALTLHRQRPGTAPALVETLLELASVRFEEGANDEAESLLREAVAIAAATEGPQGPGVAAATTDLAAVFRARGQFDEAESLSREAIAMRRAAGDAAGLADALNGLGVILNDARRPADAVVVLREAVGLSRAARADHTKTVLAECNLAQALHRSGELDAAIQTFERCIADRRRLLGETHPDVGLALNNLALVHSNRNEYEAAERLMTEALAIQRAAYGDKHTAVAGTLNNLAILGYQQGDYLGAAARFRELIGVWRALVGPDHPNTLTTTNNLGMSLRNAGDLAGAETMLAEVLEGRARALGPDHPQVGESRLNLASVIHRRGRFVEARRTAERARGELERAYAPDHPMIATADVLLGRCRLAEGAPAAALADFDRALALRTKIFGADHLQASEARVGRGRALAALGRREEGVREIETAIANLEAAGHGDSATAREAREVLADLTRRR
jgi:serine/threonine-protein kinase